MGSWNVSGRVLQGFDVCVLFFIHIPRVICIGVVLHHSGFRSNSRDSSLVAWSAQPICDSRLLGCLDLGWQQVRAPTFLEEVEYGLVMSTAQVATIGLSRGLRHWDSLFRVWRLRCWIAWVRRVNCPIARRTSMHVGKHLHGFTAWGALFARIVRRPFFIHFSGYASITARTVSC